MRLKGCDAESFTPADTSSDGTTARHACTSVDNVTGKFWMSCLLNSAGVSFAFCCMGGLVGDSTINSAVHGPDCGTLPGGSTTDSGVRSARQVGSRSAVLSNCSNIFSK